MILIDSSVLIDVLEARPPWAQWSQRQLGLAKNRGRLLINVLIYAELARDFLSQSHLKAFLTDVGLALDPVTDDIAYLAAKAHQDYRAQGGARSATLPDFFIGAHASAAKFELLTRDPKRIRTYFPDVVLICPE